MINFFVPGAPATAGSKTGFYNKKLKRVLMVPANKKQKPWMAQVRAVAVENYSGPVLTGPIKLYLLFTFLRPKSHYGSGKNADKIKESAPEYHTTKPDLTKLIRAVEDALTSIIWRDDSQVVLHDAEKSYGDTTGVRIGVVQL